MSTWLNVNIVYMSNVYPFYMYHLDFSLVSIFLVECNGRCGELDVRELINNR